MFFFKVDWLVVLPVCATVASFCFAFLFTFAQVDGDSMLPNIENESTVFVSYLDKVDRFDVVVAYINSSDNVNVGVNTSEYYIKRVIGLQGDQITLVKGVLTIKGNEYETSTVVDEYYFSKETFNKFKLFWKEDYNFDGVFTYIEDNEVKTSFIIPNGYYFVVGDNRINSNDSRKIGLVKEDNIEGVVWFELSSSGLERVK